jgi:Domain of unknown function (DUF4020)
MSDGFLDMLVATTGHREQLGARAAGNLPRLLARIAVEAEADPSAWLKDFITTGSTADHVEWARAIGFELDSLEAEAVSTQWDRWIRDYMTDRIRSIPRKLDPAEASAMAVWVLYLGDSMVAAIELLLQVQTVGLDLHNQFSFRHLGDAQIDRAPEQVARLVGHLLSATQGEFHGALELKRVYEKLVSSGVSPDALRDIAEAAMKLNITLN